MVRADIALKNKGGFVQPSALLSSLPFLFLTLLALLSFANSLGGFFLCDDLLHLDYFARAFTFEPDLLLAPFYSPWLKDSSFYAFYRPLSELSLAMDFSLFTSHAFGYHLTSLIWHITNVFLLYALVHELMLMPCFFVAGDKQRDVVALFSAAIWACYPTHSEAVSWISARSDLMATAFYFVTLLLFAKTFRGRQISIALVALPLVLGLLSKELTVSLPFVLFLMALFSTNYEKHSQVLCWKIAASRTALFFGILLAYLIVRALALGDFVGGYTGSVGQALNKSIVDRWFYGPSFFKLFHPFNDQIINADSPLRLALRLVWALCGIITLIHLRLWKSIAGKNRLMLFTLLWLILSLLPNLQVWNFSTTMAGGRIAYLPTAPLTLLLVLAVYPLGASLLQARPALFIKILSLITFMALIIIETISSGLNNIASLEASQMVRSLRGQLGDLTDDLGEKQKLILVNLPTNIKGAFAFTNPGMVAPLVKPPLSLDDSSNRIVVLDAQPCSYPQVNFSDWKAVISDSEKIRFQFYYFDQDLRRLRKVEKLTTNQSKNVLTAEPVDRSGVLNLHDNEKGGENFRFKFQPALSPNQFEYARLSLTLSDTAELTKTTAERTLCYVWSNAPADEEGHKDAFSSTQIALPAKGKTANYTIRIGSNKRWLLSHDVSLVQMFIPDLKDSGCKLNLQFISGLGISPSLKASVSGESAADGLLSLKNLHAGETLNMTFDASLITGAKTVKIEMLPAFNYFEHYTSQLYKPAFIAQHLKIIDKDAVAGNLTFKPSDFPKPGLYQLRACALNAAGEIVGDFSEPITVTVTFK